MYRTCQVIATVLFIANQSLDEPGGPSASCLHQHSPPPSGAAYIHIHSSLKLRHIGFISIWIILCVTSNSKQTLQLSSWRRNIVTSKSSYQAYIDHVIVVIAASNSIATNNYW